MPQAEGTVVLQTPLAARLPSVIIRPCIPSGEALAAWTVKTVLRVCGEADASPEGPAGARALTADRVRFLALEAIQEIERAERDPQGTLLYQVCRAGGVPPDYLDTMFLPLISSLDGVGVYWHALAEKPVLYVSRDYLEGAFSNSDEDVRLCSALSFGDNLIRVWLDVLPVPRPVPAQHLARVRECFRSSVGSEIREVKRRFTDTVRAHELSQGLQLFNDVLDSAEASYTMQGARLGLRFAGRNPLAVEHELGRAFQLGVLSILGERLRGRLRELAYCAFLRRFRPDRRQEQALRAMEWPVLRVLRAIGLAPAAALGEAYANSDVPLYYRAADSKRINPWSYPA